VLILCTASVNILESYHSANPNFQTVKIALDFLKSFGAYFTGFAAIYGAISANASIVALKESRQKDVLIPEKLASKLVVDFTSIKNTNGEFGKDTKDFLSKIHFYLQGSNLVSSKEVASVGYFQPTLRNRTISVADFVEMFTYALQHFPQEKRIGYLELIFQSFVSSNNQITMFQIEFAYYAFLCHIGIRVEKNLKIDLIKYDCLSNGIDIDSIANEVELNKVVISSLRFVTSLGNSLMNAITEANQLDKTLSLQAQLLQFINNNL
jgi:hypothetical protein